MSSLYVKSLLQSLHVSSTMRRVGIFNLHFAKFPTQVPRRLVHNPADDPDFLSVVDNPPILVKSGRQHGPGLIILGSYIRIMNLIPSTDDAALIPITAFALGTWQVFRLGWKTELIAKYEDRLIRTPLPLPPQIDPTVVKDFDYRRVYAMGYLRHDREMLIGPRMHDGHNGYLVVTPLERDGDGTTVLVNRGWISKSLRKQADREEGLPKGEVMVEGLLREPWKKNYFTPENKPEFGEFYFPDVEQMAKVARSQPIWIEETMGTELWALTSDRKADSFIEPDLLTAYDREAKGVPIGRAAEVNLRNNHTQYIFTWYVIPLCIFHLSHLRRHVISSLPCNLSLMGRYALSAATTIMMWMVVRRPPSDIARRVRQNKEW